MARKSPEGRDDEIRTKYETGDHGVESLAAEYKISAIRIRQILRTGREEEEK